MLLTEDEIAAVFAPSDRARTLPPRAYLDADFFQRERAEVFWGGWAALCLEDSVPNAGDAIPLDFVGAPLLVVRGHDGNVRVFHNICPYDQCPVLIEPTSGVEQLEAAYHGWRYDLEGKLLAAPYWHGPADSSIENAPVILDLKEIPIGRFGPVLFANVSANAKQSFDDFIAPLKERYLDIDLESLTIGCGENGLARIDYAQWLGNWKTHHENACINVYHENFVHAAYRASNHVPRVTPDGDKLYENICDRGLRGLRFSHDAAGDTYLDLGVPQLQNRSGRPVGENIIVSLFPNLYVSLIGAHLHVTIVTPVSQHEVTVITASLYARDVATDAALLPLRSIVEGAWEVAGTEDAAIIAAIHRARLSPAASAGFYAPFWDESHWDFNQQLVRSLNLQLDHTS